jgi:alanyl-tRNA synthetase
MRVINTVRPVPDIAVHRAEVLDGRIAAGDEVDAVVDAERRLDIARNHTATHLLHRALRQVLGEHAAQAGSLVAPDRLRFDYSHLSAPSRDELRRVEQIVNARIRDNLPLSTRVTSHEEAIKSGVIALFGEKYGDQVRVVTVQDYTAELCGGTHLAATGQIGQFLIVGESSIGSGLRRIEALTGRGAENHIRARLGDLESLADALSARPGEEVERVSALVAQLREQRRMVQDLQRQLAAGSVDDLLARAVQVDGVQVLAQVVEAADVDALRGMCDRFRERMGSAVVALGALIDDRPMLVVALTQDVVQRGLHAGKLASAVARQMGGGGGGRPDIAQAGGKDSARLPEALGAVPELVAGSLNAE